MISDRNCIQICYGLTLIRVYWIDGEYYLNLVDLEKIHPAILRKSWQARDWLVNLLKNESNIDVKFYFRIDTPIETKIMINDLNGYYSELDLIHKCFLLLIE